MRWKTPVLLGLVSVVSPVAAAGQDAGPRFINPPTLVTPTGYTHVVLGADGRTVYIAGQVAFDSTGKVVGVGDLRAQAEQVFANLRRALASVGGSFSDLVKTTTYLVNVGQTATLREIRTKYLDRTNPPANTLVGVTALARPDFLIEIEAVAILRTPVRR